MLGIFTGMAVMALTFPDKARFVPLLISIPGALFCLAQLALDIRQQGRTADTDAEPDSREDPPKSTARAEVIVFAWLAVFFAGLLGFGFLYGSPVLVFFYLRFGVGESWLVALLGGIGVWVILYSVFSRLLEVVLFEGHVLNWLF